MKILSPSAESRIIQSSIVLFWSFFWLLSTLDKIIPYNSFLWLGKDSGELFLQYFSVVGVTYEPIPIAMLWIVSISEGIAAIFMIASLVALFVKKPPQARTYFFWGIIVTTGIFTLFTLGDQVFGAGDELLEHSIYWMVALVSWTVYSHVTKET